MMIYVYALQKKLKALTNVGSMEHVYDVSLG